MNDRYLNIKNDIKDLTHHEHTLRLFSGEVSSRVYYDARDTVYDIVMYASDIKETIRKTI